MGVTLRKETGELLADIAQSCRHGEETYLLARQDMDDLGRLLEEAPPSLLTRAEDAVRGARGRAYGHPRVDFACTARLWSALLTRATGQSVQVPVPMVPILMAALKLSRLAGDPQHEDSALDVAGYMLTLEMLWEPEE